MNDNINYPKIIEDFLQKEDIQDTDEIISAYTLEQICSEENKMLIQFIFNLQTECNELAKKINDSYNIKDKLKRIVPGKRLVTKKIKSINLKLDNQKPMLVIELIPIYKDKITKPFKNKNTNIIHIMKQDNHETLEAATENCNGLIVTNNYQDFLKILIKAEEFLEKYKTHYHEEFEFLSLYYGKIYQDEFFELRTKPGLLISKTCQLELTLINQETQERNKIIRKKTEILRKIPLKISLLPKIYQDLIKYYQNSQKEQSKVKVRRLEQRKY